MICGKIYCGTYKVYKFSIFHTTFTKTIKFNRISNFWRMNLNWLIT